VTFTEREKGFQGTGRRGTRKEKKHMRGGRKLRVEGTRKVTVVGVEHGGDRNLQSGVRHREREKSKKFLEGLKLGKEALTLGGRKGGPARAREPTKWCLGWFKRKMGGFDFVISCKKRGGRGGGGQGVLWKNGKKKKPFFVLGGKEIIGCVWWGGGGGQWVARTF